MAPKALAKHVILANGDIVPLQPAAMYYGMLTTYLEGHEAEWDPIFLLREHAFGRRLEPSQLHTLREEKLIDQSGVLDGILRSVVLSSVRGQGRAIHLDSPFTDSHDRALAELLHAQSVVRATSPDEVTELLNFDPVGDLMKRAKWKDRIRGDNGDPDLPPR